MAFARRLGFLWLFWGMAVFAHAQPADLTGFSFLRLEPSARASALGGAFAAVYGDDVNALFYNPALLNVQTDGALSVSYLNHVSDLRAGFVAYGREWSGIGSVGVGLRFLSWGELDRANEFGERDGTFRAGDVALTLGAARPLNEQMQYGANVHWVYSSIGSYNAMALATDVGVLYHVAAQQLVLSASVNNLGVSVNDLGTTNDKLPVDVRVGVSKRLRHLPLVVNVMGYNLHDLGDAPAEATALDQVFYHIALGGEFVFSEAFNIRLGYNHRRHDALKTKTRLDLAGFGIGAGLRISRIRIDYAFNSWSSFGGLHQFTVRTHL